eukprot:TRINITY_DN5128_c0_g1_i1.p1 TRINITY_DN5128_c0_g1~~TRINITY_DN5128_c0_g1_i1.p1  ORF type:complete len:284 (-),score=21.75 TRINITY_DN5128_c0_g1_i1:643-1461(-)
MSVSRPAIRSRTLCFLHGDILRNWMWHEHVKLLPTYRCLTPALFAEPPALGKSTWTIEGTADSIARLIKAEEPGGKVHVVGHSLGNAVALVLIHRYPELVDSVVFTQPVNQPLLLLKYDNFLSRWAARLAYGPIDSAQRGRPVDWDYVGFNNPRLLECLANGRMSFDFFRHLLKLQAEFMPENFPARDGIHCHLRPLILTCTKELWANSRTSARFGGSLVKSTKLWSFQAGLPEMKSANWPVIFPKEYTEALIAWIEDQEPPPNYRLSQKAE